MSSDARTHDKFYLHEDRYKNPKEMFKFVLKNALEFHREMPSSILDVGCAAGEYAYFLKKSIPDSRVVGIDVVPELIARAETKVDDVEFTVGSVLERRAINETFDLVFFVGVHSIFDEISPWLENLVAWCNPGGTIAVFGLVNSHDVDVYVRVRSAEQSEEHREPGWNVLSQRTFSNVLKSMRNVASFEFVDFQLPIDLEPNESDPLRSWTVRLDDGTRQVINGACIVHDLKLLLIKKHERE